MSEQPNKPEPGMDLIMDLEVPISVRFGSKQMVLDEVLKFGQGSLIELDKMAEEPVDLLVNDKLLAKGEVVVVEGNYAIRITEILSAAERMRSLGV